MNIKYVVFDEMLAILLPGTIQHRDVKTYSPFGTGQVTSAGFCSFGWNPEKGRFEVQVWGESISLNKKSNPKTDVFAIEFLLNES